MAGQTPWQTTGPFFHFGMPWKGGADLTGDSDSGSRPDLIQPRHDSAIAAKQSHRDRVLGQRIEIFGHVWDNKDAPILDCLIEIWQANAAGRYAHPEDSRSYVALDAAFIGFGRAASGKDGESRFRTVRPGPVPGPGNSLQAPHIALGIMGPGFLKRLVTRIYFAGEPKNSEDPILNLVPQHRRSTLISVNQPAAPNIYRFDIRLSGPRETVFFDI
jgi:protocatechuate 3,4-dioxygenase alpha subunit